MFGLKKISWKENLKKKIRRKKMRKNFPLVWIITKIQRENELNSKKENGHISYSPMSFQKSNPSSYPSLPPSLLTMRWNDESSTIEHSPEIVLSSVACGQHLPSTFLSVLGGKYYWSNQLYFLWYFPPYFFCFLFSVIQTKRKK